MKSLLIYLLTLTLFLSSCSEKQGVKTIAFLDAFEDETVSRAKKGFFVALNDSGYIPSRNLEVIYRNAQSDIPLLSQSVDFFLSRNVDLIATNTTLSTIAAAQKTNSVPICMMVSPSPELAGLLNKEGLAPANLFGVYETLEYIDTALSLVPKLFPDAKTIGVLINQSEPQSRDALGKLKAAATLHNLNIIDLPANSGSETQMVTQALIAKKIDVFFALPDNTIFSSFETIVAECDKAGVPIISSESGLVERGALAAFGADFYQWGYEAGQQAAIYLRTGVLPKPQRLAARRIIINNSKAGRYGIQADSLSL